jgi:hypothetical protein
MQPIKLISRVSKKLQRVAAEESRKYPDAHIEIRSEECPARQPLRNIRRARLAAGCLSNRQIGASLSVSTRAQQLSAMSRATGAKRFRAAVPMEPHPVLSHSHSAA